MRKKAIYNLLTMQACFKGAWAQCDDAYWDGNLKYKKNQDLFWDKPTTGERLYLLVNSSGTGGWYKFTPDMMWNNPNSCPWPNDCIISTSNNQEALDPNVLVQNIYHGDTNELWTQFQTSKTQGDKSCYMICKNPSSGTGNWISGSVFKTNIQATVSSDCCANETLTDSQVDRCIKIQRFTKPPSQRIDEIVYPSNNPSVDGNYSTNYELYETLGWVDNASPPCDNNTWPVWFEIELDAGDTNTTRLRVEQQTGKVSYLVDPAITSNYQSVFVVNLKIGKNVGGVLKTLQSVRGLDGTDFHKLKIDKPTDVRGSNQCFKVASSPSFNYPLIPGWFSGTTSYQYFTIDYVNQGQFIITGTVPMQTRTPCDIYHLRIEQLTGNSVHPNFVPLGLATTPTSGQAMTIPSPFILNLTNPESTTPGLYQFKIKYCTFGMFLNEYPTCDLNTRGEFIKDPFQNDIFTLNVECPSNNVPVIGSFPTGKGFTQETMVSPVEFFPQVITNVNPCNEGAISFTANYDGPAMTYISATSTTDALVKPNTETLHTRYQFEIRIYSTATTPKFTEMTTSLYTLIYGCPQSITDIDPGAVPWTLTGTTISFPYNQVAGVTYNFAFPKTIGPTQCTHSWEIVNQAQTVASNIVLDQTTLCSPSAACTTFTVKPFTGTTTASDMTFDIKLKCLQNAGLVYHSSATQSFTINMRCPPSTYLDTVSATSSYTFAQQTTNIALPNLQKFTFASMCTPDSCCIDAMYVIEEVNHVNLTGPKTAIVAGATPHPAFGVTIDTTNTGQFDFRVKVFLHGIEMQASALVNVKIECNAIYTTTQPAYTYQYDLFSNQEITITNFTCQPAVCCFPMSYTTLVVTNSATGSIDPATVLQTTYNNGTHLKIPVNTLKLGNFRFEIQGNNNGELTLSQQILVNISCLSITLADQSQVQAVTTFQDVLSYYVEITPPSCQLSVCCANANFLNTTSILFKNPSNLKSASLLSAPSWFQGTKKVRVLVNTTEQGTFSFRMLFNSLFYSSAVQSQTVSITIKNKCFDDVITLRSDEISGNERQAAGMPPATQLIWQGYEDVKMNLSLSHLLYQDLAFNISQRFVSFYDCPISNFKISRIENMNTSLLVQSQFYTMNVSSSGTLNITALQEFSNLKVTIDAFNGFKWSTLADPLLVVQVYNDTELNPPEPEPVPEKPKPTPPPVVNFTLPQKKPVVKVVEVKKKKEEKKEIKEAPKIIVTRKSIELTPKVYVHKFNYVKEEEKKIETPEIKDYEVPRLRITEINRKGNITIMFNQELIIPGFVKTALNRTKMRQEILAKQPKLGNATLPELGANKSDSLLAIGESQSSSSGQNSSDNLPDSLQDIDVQKDVFETFIVFSEHKEDYTMYGYAIEILEWTEAFMKLRLLFDNPHLISKTYDLDQLYFNIQNPEMFRARNSGMMPTTAIEKLVPPKSIPKQLPVGFDEDELRKSLSGAFQGVVYGQIVGAFFIKSSVKKMWHFFFYLQMYCAIPQIQQNFPINLEIAFEQFRMIVFFEILKPDVLMKALGIKLNMSFDELIWGTKQTDDRSYFQTDPKTFVILCIIGLAGLLIISLIGVVVYKYNDKILKKVKEIVKQFFFNSTIQAIYVSYLPQIIGITDTIALMVWQHKEVSDLTFYSTYSILGVLVIIPLVFYIWLMINRFNLKGNAAKEKRFGALYQGIRLPFDHIHHNACFFYPWFLVRRLVYVWVCFALYKRPEWQIPASMVVHMVYNCWVLNAVPLETSGKNMLLALYDFTLVIIAYFQMWIVAEDDFQTQWNVGFVIIVIPFVMIVLQIYQIANDVYHSMVRKRLLKKQKMTQDKLKIMLIALREDFKKRLIEQRGIVKDQLIAEREMKEQARQAGISEEMDKKEWALMKQRNAEAKAWAGQGPSDKITPQSQQFGDPTFTKAYDSQYLNRVNKNSGAARVNILKMPIDATAKKSAQGNKVNPRFISTDDDLKMALRDAFKMKLMPPEPIHFEVYPSILPKTKHVRLNHKKIVNAIESNYLYREGKDGVAFEQERTEREQIRRKQSSLNADLSKKIQTLRPGLQLGFLRDKIMEEDSCLLGSLEYELALTLELVHVFRMVNQDNQ